MEETELVLQDSGLRQGDIIKLYGELNSKYGVIVNADCDLANDKIDGHIAYVPIYSFPDFIERFWAGDQIQSIKKQCQNELRRFLKTQPEVNDLMSWLGQESVDSVILQISGHLALKPKESGELEKIIRKLNACLQGTTLKCLTDIYSLEKNPEKYTSTQLSSLKSNLGEGHLMISCIVGIEGLGFVMRMKRVFSLCKELCFRSSAEHLIKSSEDTVSAVRVARLTSTYKYKAAQIFAQNFTRIGLSDEVSRLNDLAIMDIVENLRKAENV
ncbi:hypothetical protein LOY43_18610 [Pseudomonas sp. B21-041]|uniref:hypothetical protein n=1 Tax=Pseudomonas sp. B21-041 TaxID=2895487 RepID=UPI00215E037A|nr:hypothetical protein [Pseudomonas sp. B21-041]UVL32980.1 hypothetical protein LOY43_18610 [Pseudomonas sp. B21-041]